MTRRFLLLVLLAGCGAAAPTASNNPASPSVAIKVDQVGYLPGEAKLAMVTASVSDSGCSVSAVWKLRAGTGGE